MNYYNLNKAIKIAALNHNLVLEFHNEDIYECLNSGQHKYPAVILTVQNLINNGVTDIQTLNGNLFYVDRLTEDFSNKIEVQSVGITVLKLVLVKLLEDYPDITIESENFTPFLEKFADICAGDFVTFSISYQNDIICSDNSFESKTLNITTNGLHDIVDYDIANVNVPTTITVSLTLAEYDALTVKDQNTIYLITE